MTFNQRLQDAWQRHQSLVCVGLDPDISKIPSFLRDLKEPLFEFNRQIIDATAAYCCCFKPQIAYYAAIGAEPQLEKTILYIKEHYPHHPVVLDAKRGDIGSTAEMYAREAFQRYQADAVTVNPYMGGDTIEPYLAYPDKGVVVLCRTSNLGSAEFQSLLSGELVVAHHVAKSAVEWNRTGNVMLVVGATYPAELKEIRQIVGDMPLLVPGVGAQGGDVKQVFDMGADSQGAGLVVNSSRKIIYAGDGEDFSEAAKIEAMRLNDQINGCRASP